MTSCCTVGGTDRFFSQNAWLYAARFRVFGLDSVQSLLMNGIVQISLSGKDILEIGCGVGGLHLRLLQRGARTAIGVEMSSEMIRKAEGLAASMHLTEKVRYLQQDFVESASAMPECAVVILDKVLCCYGDPGALIAAAASKSTDILAISYPRDGFLARHLFGMSSWLGEMLSWTFHPYYHDPAAIEGMVDMAGFRSVFKARTAVWQVSVYGRKG